MARLWPALPLLALALTVLVAIVGVVAAPGTPEVERLDDAVHDVATAVAEQRGADACALMTPATQAAVAARIGTLACPAVIRSFGAGFPADRLRTATVRGATITGDRATVATDQVVVPDGAPYGAPLQLERTGGSWRLAALP